MFTAGPVIKQTRNRYEVEVGHRIALPCEVGGSLKPEITWQKAGKQIIFSEKNILLRNNGGLFIRSANLEHTGLYVCTASNEVGSAQRKVFLNVIRRSKTLCSFLKI